MAVFVQTLGSEVYVYMNGKLLYKKWLETGQSVVFDVMPYTKHTYTSITDNSIKNNINK